MIGSKFLGEAQRIVAIMLRQLLVEVVKKSSQLLLRHRQVSEFFCVDLLPQFILDGFAALLFVLRRHD